MEGQNQKLLYVGLGVLAAYTLWKLNTSTSATTTTKSTATDGTEKMQSSDPRRVVAQRYPTTLNSPAVLKR